MVTHEQDSGLLQWGLRLLDTGPVYNSGYYGDVIHHGTDDTYHGQYYRDHYDTECSHVDNDEIIAHALQEEFSRLAVTETSGYSHAGEEQYHAPISGHDWHIPSTGNYFSVHEGCHDEDYGGPSSSRSSTDYAYEYPNSLELSDEYMLDGETGKRLNEMIPIPHVPRINGEIPSTDEATSDYQRLLDRLQVYNLVERKVQGDGNCQFRALSDQLYCTPEHHKFVRQKIVNQLKSHPESYEGYVPMAYSDYLKKMSKSGEWGDHVTLQAAADSCGMKIFVITSFKDTCYIEILPNFQKSKGVIFLSFWAEVHYNSIHPPEVQYDPIDSPEKGDMSSGEFRKKKKWWIFGSNH